MASDQSDTTVCGVCGDEFDDGIWSGTSIECSACRASSPTLSDYAPDSGGSDNADKEGSRDPVTGTSPGRLSEAVAEANGALRQLDVHLELSVDERSEEVVARVVNDHTGEVVREIPREEVRELARRLQEASGGALLDKHG